MVGPGSKNLTTEEFLDYLRAFNSTDYSNQHAFYSDDVVLILPDPAIPPLEGKEAIVRHYTPIHADADETVVPINIFCDRGRVAFFMESYFQYKREIKKAVHDYHVHPGDVLKITCLAVYDLDEDKKMKTIRCHLQKQELLGQVDLRACIRDSESRADPDIRLYNY